MDMVRILQDYMEEHNLHDVATAANLFRIDLILAYIDYLTNCS